MVHEADQKDPDSLLDLLPDPGLKEVLQDLVGPEPVHEVVQVRHLAPPPVDLGPPPNSSPTVALVVALVTRISRVPQVDLIPLVSKHELPVWIHHFERWVPREA